MDKVLELVKENHKKLKSCNYHEFEDITPNIIYGKKYKCKNCNGVLDSINVNYYNLGLQHQKERIDINNG